MKSNCFRDLITTKYNEANVVLTGIPYDKGCSCEKGAADAPRVMRELSSFLPACSMNGDILTKIKMYDTGDIFAKDIPELIEKCHNLFDDDKFQLILGGDHSATIATQKAFLKRTEKHNKIPAIIHIDAHPDFCAFYDGSAYSHACTNYQAVCNGYKPDNIVLVGIRGYEIQEVEYFLKHPEITIFNASSINRNGIEEVIAKILARFNDDYEIYLSYDIDANDPSFAPGTGTPEAFGLASTQILKLIMSVVKNLNITAMDIVEVSPPHDSNNMTSWLALKTIYEVFNVLINKNNF